ncbi:6-phosphogluconolactonase [Burkholderia sp. SRS-W-2-2016]|uniref:lactonase family protein n=1 Tax=Burkholderia sp. SRS-W-2-2016 TaxID=1926878 RepID=UPI00094B1740|nr:lactonase family protein [Burkholderia sp. SRS-W-2-2016]OLL31565.1 6-phosphogluconolactonase [Burkholderia sp. SRS-W-2-2016]
MTRLFQKNRVARRALTAAGAALTLSVGSFAAPLMAAALAPAPHTELVYVGTLQKQIGALRLDTSSGALTAIGPVASGPKSTWVSASPTLPVLYAVDDDSTKEGSITAYAVDRDNGSLGKINSVLTGGRGTTFLRVDPRSATVFGANYNSGSVSSVAINPDGSVGALVSTIEETGSGPNRRQASAHAHAVAIDPSGRYALVPDLGADRVFVYRFDRATHALAQDDTTRAHSYVAPPGSGPRHLEFGANGQFVYLLTELSAEVIVFRWDAAQGTLTQVQSLPISSDGFAGVKSGAEIALSHDGRFVYVENRGENSLVVYRVNPHTGELSLLQRVSSGGEKPWGFGIDATGKWLLVANQRSGKVTVFGIDTESGTLSDTGQAAELADPTSIAFVQ